MHFYLLKSWLHPLVASIRCLCPWPTQASWFVKSRPQNQHLNVGCSTMLSDAVGTTVYFLPHTLLSLSFKLNLSLTVPFGHSLLRWDAWQLATRLSQKASQFNSERALRVLRESTTRCTAPLCLWSTLMMFVTSGISVSGWLRTITGWLSRGILTDCEELWGISRRVAGASRGAGSQKRTEAWVDGFWDLLTGESTEDVSPMRFLFSDTRGPLDSLDPEAVAGTDVEEFESSGQGEKMLALTGSDRWFTSEENMEQKSN